MSSSRIWLRKASKHTVTHSDDVERCVAQGLAPVVLDQIIQSKGRKGSTANSSILQDNPAI